MLKLCSQIRSPYLFHRWLDPFNLGRSMLFAQILATVLLAAQLVGAQPTPDVAAPNRSCSIYLEYGVVDTVATVFGLDTVALRARMERRLSKAGLQVVGRGTPMRLGIPTLVVSVRISRSLNPDPDQFALGGIQLALVKTARLNNRGVSSGPPVWTSPTSGQMHMFPTLTSLANALPRLAMLQLDEFIAAKSARGAAKC
jgi:hypothetical protein